LAIKLSCQTILKIQKGVNMMLNCNNCDKLRVGADIDINGNGFHYAFCAISSLPVYEWNVAGVRPVWCVDRIAERAILIRGAGELDVMFNTVIRAEHLFASDFLFDLITKERSKVA
jgi:hypothetical protein